MIATVPVSLEIESDQVEEPQSEKSGSVHKSIVKIRTIYEKRNERDSAYGWFTSVIWTGVATAMITIGSIYMHSCSSSLIPVYLVVEGALILVEMIRQVCRRLDVIGEKRDDLGCVPQTFLFIWLIVGSVWVYGTYDNVTHNSFIADHYCHRVPFVFALVQITTFWCLLVLAMFFQCVAYSPWR